MAEPRIPSSQAIGSVVSAAEALLNARNQAPKLQRIFEHSPVPMVILDAGRRYVEVNRPARLMLGLGPDDVRAFRLDDFTPSHLSEHLEQAWTRLLEAGFLAGHHEVVGRNGSSLDFVYHGIAHALPGLQLIAFAPADWTEDELDADELDADEADGPAPTASLTPREIQVLALAAEGSNGPELARELVLSPTTVNTHFKHIYEKLEVRNRGAAVAKAMRLGVID
jgi:PAS domain S-box-containing protein